MLRHSKLLLTAFLFIAGCGLDRDLKQFEVAERNELGVTAIETEHTTSDGNPVFELRALDAGGTAVAEVKMRIGVVPDMLDLNNSGTERFGTEVLIAVGDKWSRSVTRETRTFVIYATETEWYEKLFSIPTVVSVLKDEANIVVVPRGIA